MEMNGFKDAGNMVATPTQPGSGLNGMLASESSLPDEPNDIHEEIRHLRQQLDRLEALQRNPQSEEVDFGEGSEDEHGDGPDPGSPAGRVASRRRRILLVVVVALAALLCMGGLKFWSYLQSYESTDDAQVDGYLDPISSRINGTVIAVYVNNNQRVKKGQLLVQLDPRDYQVAVEQARAQLELARAQFASAQQDYEAALAKVREDQAANFKAQRDARRYAVLLHKGVVPQEQYDQFIATAKVDFAAVDYDMEEADSARKVIAARKASVDAAKAALDQAELNLTYTRIMAPASGIIGNRSAQLGQRVQPGQSLMALTQMNSLWVTANFKETQLARMRPGQRVTIDVDALGRDLEGHVLSMPGATGSLYDLLPPENATGNYVKIVQRLPVRITFDRGQDLAHLRPGMSVEPTVWLR